MRRPIATLTSLGLALAGVMTTALVYYERTAARSATPARAAVFVTLLVLGVVLYGVAVRLVLRGSPSAPAVWIVLGVAAFMRLAFLPSPPLLSTDIYRYIWDGKVQAAGINPYLAVPADPILAVSATQRSIPGSIAQNTPARSTRPWPRSCSRPSVG